MSPRRANKRQAATQADAPATCNICGSLDFADYRGREKEKCSSCGSLARHRVAFEVYRRSGVFKRRRSPPFGLRVLHLAPEAIVADKIRDAALGGYLTADARPEAFGKAQCLKLLLPDGLDIFPDGYFDYILHNHVLEHVPGSFRDHVLAFARILKPGGRMIFSVPGPRMGMVTEEGGEHLANDKQRLARFGQADHLKQFGRDLPEYLASLPDGRFTFDDLTAETRRRISVKPNSNRFLIWERTV